MRGRVMRRAPAFALLSISLACRRGAPDTVF
jgi:hypothetical protein